MSPHLSNVAPMTNTATASREFLAVEHYSGMYAVVNMSNGDTVNLYSDAATATRVAAKNTALCISTEEN